MFLLIFHMSSQGAAETPLCSLLFIHFLYFFFFCQPSSSGNFGIFLQAAATLKSLALKKFDYVTFSVQLLWEHKTHIKKNKKNGGQIKFVHRFTSFRLFIYFFFILFFIFVVADCCCCCQCRTKRRRTSAQILW